MPRGIPNDPAKDGRKRKKKSRRNSGRTPGSKSVHALPDKNVRDLTLGELFEIIRQLREVGSI